MIWTLRAFLSRIICPNSAGYFPRMSSINGVVLPPSSFTTVGGVTVTMGVVSFCTFLTGLQDMKQTNRIGSAMNFRMIHFTMRQKYRKEGMGSLFFWGRNRQ